MTNEEVAEARRMLQACIITGHYEATVEQAVDSDFTRAAWARAVFAAALDIPGAGFLWLASDGLGVRVAFMMTEPHGPADYRAALEPFGRITAEHWGPWEEYEKPSGMKEAELRGFVRAEIRRANERRSW